MLEESGDPESLPPEPAVVARGIRMSGPWGPVYGPVDLTVAAGGVTVLVCPGGTGRTALLMTLAGRMRPVAGELTVLGEKKATQIFARSALAGIDELDSINESVTVNDAVTETLRWDAAWYRLVRRADRSDLERVCGSVFGEVPLPALAEYVEELSELDRMLLRISLANTARPPLLVVGNLDQVTHDRSREVLLERLVDLGRSQTVITATVNEVRNDGIRDQFVVDNVARADLVAHASDARKEGE